jgi:hypothetical protein
MDVATLHAHPASRAKGDPGFQKKRSEDGAAALDLGRSTFTKLLLACGAVSSVLYVVGIDVIVALRYPNYHRFTDQMVSELMAVGAPTRTLLTWLFIPYNVLVFAFAAGVWLTCRKRAVRLTAIAITGYALISTAGLLVAPMDMRGTVDSERDALHIAATMVMSLFIVAVMACGAFVHGRRFRLYSFATIATVIAFGALAGILAAPMPGPTPWLGLAERVNIYATMVWIAVLTLALWPTPAHRSLSKGGS